jgi:hypothetical protein
MSDSTAVAVFGGAEPAAFEGYAERPAGMEP